MADYLQFTVGGALRKVVGLRKMLFSLNLVLLLIKFRMHVSSVWRGFKPWPLRFKKRKESLG